MYETDHKRLNFNKIKKYEHQKFGFISPLIFLNISKLSCYFCHDHITTEVDQITGMTIGNHKKIFFVSTNRKETFFLTGKFNCELTTPKKTNFCKGTLKGQNHVQLTTLVYIFNILIH